MVRNLVACWTELRTRFSGAHQSNLVDNRLLGCSESLELKNLSGRFFFIPSCSYYGCVLHRLSMRPIRQLARPISQLSVPPSNKPYWSDKQGGIHIIRSGTVSRYRSDLVKMILGGGLVLFYEASWIAPLHCISGSTTLGCMLGRRHLKVRRHPEM
jgi:hypothetical protein